MAPRKGSSLGGFFSSKSKRGAARRGAAEAGAGGGKGLRPEGALAWIHVSNSAESLGVPELIERLRDARDDVAVLVTTAERDTDDLLASRLPGDTIVEPVPASTTVDVARFLERWRPDVCVWADNRFDPTLIAAADEAGVPLFLVDARVPGRTGWRWLPGMRRALLRRFDFVIAVDAAAAEGLAGLGVPADRIEACGFLQEGTAPLPCSSAERDSVAEVLAARPVWLAAGVSGAEVGIVIDAHRQAMRRAHRLLLIVAPQDPGDGPALATRLDEEGWVTALRSQDDEPGPEVEVFVADVPDELGLWYRLSPIALMGGSLAGTGKDRVQNPYEAAALGSAVLYGPHLGLWRESFERLRSVGAARAVSDVESLTRAVEFLLAPDVVAKMATAAWEVTTSGAEATDRAVALVLDALDTRGV
ncbi:MAG: 3-deoxy-D-manno-octulosonic acid transferase [Maritimibacter sp.]|nr:3-deoxy-D-manno-octulosonic acid transferase [Maritimibacter sp.]